MIQNIKSKINILIITFFLIFTLFDKCTAQDFKFINHLQKKDIEVLKKALKEGDKAKWSRSLRIAKQSKSLIVKKIVDWRWLSASDAIASYEKTRDFFVNNENWPDRKVLQRRLENRLSYNNDKNSILLWFQNILSLYDII